MCVIIIIPQGETISKEELKKAWTTNPDGAGYVIQQDGELLFERGFMDFNSFYQRIEHKIGRSNMMVHFRITTSNKINKLQTHPYKKGNIELLRGRTSRPVICMNGTIPSSKYTDNSKYNDTMCFINDYESVFAKPNQRIIDMVADFTGARWAIFTPTEFYYSSDFIEKDGKFYSNTNHLITYSYLEDYGQYFRHCTIKSQIRTKKLRREIYKDKDLSLDVEDFIYFNCNNYMCHYCEKCLKDCFTVQEIQQKVEQYFGTYGG